MATTHILDILLQKQHGTKKFHFMELEEMLMSTKREYFPRAPFNVKGPWNRKGFYKYIFYMFWKRNLTRQVKAKTSTVFTLTE